MRNLKNAAPVVAVAGLALILAACAPANGHNADSGEASGAGAAAAGAGSSSGGGDTVATVGSVKISRAELEEHLATINFKAVQDYYDAQTQALNALINTKLMETAAAGQNITAEQLQAQLLTTAGEVSEEQIGAFYEQNKSRMGLNSLDAMREQIRGYLINQGQQQVLLKYLSEQKTAQGVAIHMDPPRVEVAIAANDPTKGPEGAAITIVEFSDFQ